MFIVFSVSNMSAMQATSILTLLNNSLQNCLMLSQNSNLPFVSLFMSVLQMKIFQKIRSNKSVLIIRTRNWNTKEIAIFNWAQLIEISYTDDGETTKVQRIDNNSFQSIINLRQNLHRPWIFHQL